MKYTWVEKEEIVRVCENKAHLLNLAQGRAKTAKKEIKDNHSDETPYVYQYRNLDSFWSIIESDSFWATNARFSNDHEEQELGIRKIKLILGEKADMIESYGDCYIVCFCDEGDKLSQWRGYATEGVSIGFDFNNVRPFYIKSAKADRYLCVYGSCYRVVYTDEKTDKEGFINLFDLDALDNLESLDNAESVRRRAAEIGPYVKHSGFYEEAESRLVFSGEEVDLSDYIHYRMVGNLKVPYIIIKAGDKKEMKPDNCIVRLCIDEARGQDLKKALEIYFKKNKNIKIINCTSIEEGEIGDFFCNGCTLREAYIPGVNGKNPRCRYACNQNRSFRIEVRNEIYLSDSKNQEYVYWELYKFLQKDDVLKDTKIWCEGHLPIRSIKVGNLHNKGIVVESIEHYCKQHYWLKSVDVTSSTTPFRSSLL